MIEALTRRAVLIPIAETMTAAVTILRHGDDAVARDLIPRVASGEAIVVPSVLEADDRFDGVQAAVDGGRLTGEKYFVDYAQVATHHLAAARELPPSEKTHSFPKD